MATYLIDYENVSKDGLNGVTRLTENDRVIIFYSERADRMTFGLHRRLNATKATIEYKKVEVGGHNALDFQLATYLGFLIAENSKEEYCVVSNDRGFEYLTGFWRKPLYDVTLTRTISESPQAEERRQARRNGRNGRGGQTDGSEADSPETAGISASGGPAAQDGQLPLSEADQSAGTAVVAVEKKPLAVIPDADNRKLDIVREKPLWGMKAGQVSGQDGQDAAEAEVSEGAGDNSPLEGTSEKPKTQRRSRRSRRSSRTRSKQDGSAQDAAVDQADGAQTAENAGAAAADSTDAAAETGSAGSTGRTGSAKAAENAGAAAADSTDAAAETGSAGSTGRTGSAKAAENAGAAAADSTDAAAETGSAGSTGRTGSAKADSAEKPAPAKRKRSSRSRKRVTIPYLTDVKNLIGGQGLADKDIEEVAGYVERYKTKQGVNNALVRKFGNQKGGEVYQSIKMLLKDKKGRVADASEKKTAEDKK